MCRTRLTIITNSSYMPKLRFLFNTNGLEEAPVFHQHGLATLERLVDLITCYVMSKSPYMPYLGSLSHPHGLDEASVVHQLGPGHIEEVDDLNICYVI